ncbi:heme exporter protein CcmD [Jiella mangrovi]|uniref:Heme exporter protein D n=1 Tax=Jiella mangrovi TaxID=2821407 RepID=A0ABS4BKP4_9HYPH|nr:heme exporter protein CcmD [Jiella mangrovi]MBP0617312.1 heme exporter protein CcmD [Jiella mangrovi]
MQAEYSAFIASAYGISAVAIAALFAWILFDARAQRRALRSLDARGIRRRSQASAAGSASEAGQ